MDKQNRNKLINTENILMVVSWEEGWGNGWKKGRDSDVQIDSYKNGYGDVMNSTGDVVNNIIITMYCFRLIRLVTS